MGSSGGGGGRGGRQGGGGGASPEATLKEFDKNISAASQSFEAAREKHADLISKFDRGKATKAEKDAALQEKKKWREVRDNLETAKAEFQKTLKK